MALSPRSSHKPLITPAGVGILALACLAPLPYIGCEKSPTPQGLKAPTPSLAQFSNLVQFFSVVEKNASTRTAPLTTQELDEVSKNFAAALKKDLEQLGYKIPSEAQPTEILATANQHLFQHSNQILAVYEELLSFQVITVATSAEKNPKRYNFGPFGNLDKEVGIFKVAAIDYDLRHMGGPPFRGCCIPFPNSSIILLDEASFTGNPALSISASQDRERTVDNEMGHAHFNSYIAASHPTLRQGDFSLLLLNEAFSVYSNLRHTSDQALLFLLFETVQSVLDQSLPSQYRATAAYLSSGLNSFLGIKDAADDVAVNPIQYQNLFNKCATDPALVDRLRKHLIHHFEENLRTDLELLESGNARAFLRR